jgi:hypothetical protein
MREIRQNGKRVHLFECDPSDRLQLADTLMKIESDIGNISQLYVGNILMTKNEEKTLMTSLASVSNHL